MTTSEETENMQKLLERFVSAIETLAWGAGQLKQFNEEPEIAALHEKASALRAKLEVASLEAQVAELEKQTKTGEENGK